VDNIYVSPLLRQFEYKIIPITEGVYGANHKAVIFQIPRQALGIDQLPQQRYRGRRLKMQDPKVQHRYLKDYKDQCSRQQIFTRATVLWDHIILGQPLTLSQQEEYKEIDRLRTQAMIRAEKQCRKLKMGGAEWSPQLAMCRAWIAMWTAMVKACTGKKISSHLIRRLMVKADYTAVPGITLQMAQINLKAETRNYYQFKQQASIQRDTFLESLAQSQAKEKMWTKQSTLRHYDYENINGKHFAISKQSQKVHNMVV